MSLEQLRSQPEARPRISQRQLEEQERFQALPDPVKEYLGILNIVNAKDHGLPREEYLDLKNKTVQLVQAMDMDQIGQMVGFCTWRDSQNPRRGKR